MAAAALLFACAAQAQDSGSVSEFRLPPAPSPAPAPVAGPTDSDHPVAAPTRPAPEPSPAASAAPSPTPTPQVTLPPAAEQRSRPVQPTQAAPPPATAEPLPQTAETPVAPTITQLPSPAASAAPTETAAPAEESDGFHWWLLGGGALALLLAGAWFVLRRRKPADTEAEAPPREVEPAATASAPATLTPIGQAPVRPAPKPQSQPQPAAGPLEFLFEPQSLRLSVVYATLSYRLTLTNRTDTAFTALKVSGDITSGHSSLPIEQQLALDGAPLEAKHDAAALAPGETLSLTGELRIPLAEVLPLRAGAALMFAPLARFRIEAGALTDTRVFTLGQPSLRSGDTMQPFRLDLGPQLFRQVEQREVDLTRWRQLDEARRAV